MTARFIGLDLAWSLRNSSACVVLEAEDGVASWITYHEGLGDNVEVLTFVRQAAGEGSALVAVDAPLIVPNEKGARPVDRQITRLFGRWGAGCYPAYRYRPGGCTRGEEIVAKLADDGFVQSPYIRRRAATRSIFEVYPHPATLALFHLEQTIKYKARPNRSASLRLSELLRLRACLVSLEQHEPAMLIPTAVTRCDIYTLQGSALKRYEDLLDAAICAYIAYYAWYWGPIGYEVYGDMNQGYILVPMSEWMRERLAKAVNKPHLTNPEKAGIL